MSIVPEAKADIKAIEKDARTAKRPLSSAETELVSASKKQRKSAEIEMAELWMPHEKNYAASVTTLSNQNEWKPWADKVERTDGEHRFSVVLAPSSLLVIEVGP